MNKIEADISHSSTHIGTVEPTRSKRGRLVFWILACLIAALIALGFLYKKPKLSEAELQRIRDLKVNSGQTSRDLNNGDKSGLDQRQSICELFDLEPPDSTDHPLDTCLKVAEACLVHMREHIDDYTATLVKRERIDGKLGEEEFVHAKIRQEKKSGESVVQPLSVYLKFLAPESVAGREVIWVSGRDNNKLIVHGTGFTRFLKVKLDPEGTLAMQGNRYPLTEIGIEILAIRLIEKGLHDKQFGDCEVLVDRNATIDGRTCTKIEIIHAEKHPQFEFHKAEVYIDEEFDVPVRYASYSWPATEGGEPVLEEEYTYRDLKINVGLTDDDFDPKNSDYAFP